MSGVESLIEVLDKQIVIYKDLLDVSNKKTSVIIEGRVRDLENITKAEQLLVVTLGNREEELDKIMPQLKTELNISSDRCNLSDIIEQVQGEGKQELVKKKDEIKKIILELESVNKINTDLIKKSLDYINFSVNLYLDTASPGSTYQQNGDVYSQKRNLFDKKY